MFNCAPIMELVCLLFKYVDNGAHVFNCAPIMELVCLLFKYGDNGAHVFNCAAIYNGVGVFTV